MEVTRSPDGEDRTNEEYDEQLRKITLTKCRDNKENDIQLNKAEALSEQPPTEAPPF